MLGYSDSGKDAGRLAGGSWSVDGLCKRFYRDTRAADWRQCLRLRLSCLTNVVGRAAAWALFKCQEELVQVCAASLPCPPTYDALVRWCTARCCLQGAQQLLCFYARLCWQPSGRHPSDVRKAPLSASPLLNPINSGRRCARISRWS